MTGFDYFLMVVWAIHFYLAMGAALGPLGSVWKPSNINMILFWVPPVFIAYRLWG